MKRIKPDKVDCEHFAAHHHDEASISSSCSDTEKSPNSDEVAEQDDT